MGCQEVGGLSWPRSSGNGSSRGEIPLNSISLQTSGIPTFKFLLFKSTHLFSNLAIIFFLLKPFMMTYVFFSQKLSLETSTTVYYSTTSGVCKNSVKIPSCTPPQASSKSTTLQQLMSIFRISPFQHSVFKSNPAGTGLEKKSIFNP